MRHAADPGRVELRALPNDDQVRLVWWYGGLRRNPDAPSEPLVEVYLRCVSPGGVVSAGFEQRRFGITHLGQLRLGSLWQGRKLIGELPTLEERDFQLDFGPNGYRFSRPGEVFGGKSGLSLIGQNVYPPTLANELQRAQLVEFHLTDSSRGLVIACFELFSRLYGRSQYVKRVLLTRRLRDADQHLWSADVPDTTPVPQGVWRINLNKYVYNDETVFIAHLKHDPMCRERVGRLWSQIEAAQSTMGNIAAYPCIDPWFTGPAQLRVRGLPMGPDGGFFGMQIVGCSHPGGVVIYRDRENTNRLVTGAIERETGRPTWGGGRHDPPLKVPCAPPPPIEFSVDELSTGDPLLTAGEEPGRGAQAQQIHDPSFEELGAPRKVVPIQRTHRNVTPAPPRFVPVGRPDQLSGGEARGHNPRTAPASIVAPAVGESRLVALETWNALKHLQGHEQQSGVRLVESLARSPRGFVYHEARNPLGFAAPSRKADTSSLGMLGWVCLSRRPLRLRRLLVARVTTSLGTGFLLEIERNTKAINGELVDTEQYRGMAFRSKAAKLPLGWDELLARIVAAEGVVKSVVDGVRQDYAETAASYKHVSDKNGGALQTVLNALEKIELMPPMRHQIFRPSETMDQSAAP